MFFIDFGKKIEEVFVWALKKLSQEMSRKSNKWKVCQWKSAKKLSFFVKHILMVKFKSCHFELEFTYLVQETEGKKSIFLVKLPNIQIKADIWVANLFTNWD